MTLILAILALVGQEDPAAARQAQKRVQLETEQTVRRINTMLRALSYHRLDTAEENRILEEVAVSLAGLSREQMTEVLSRLEAAAKAPESEKARAETEAAYAKHREVVDALGRLLSRYDSVRSLDQAAERFERLAQDTLELHLQAVHVTRVGGQILAVDKAEEAERKAAEADAATWNKDKEKDFNRRRDSRSQLRSAVTAMADRLSDEQGDVQRGVVELVGQLAELKKALPAEQVERLVAVEALVKERNTPAAIEEAVKRLKNRDVHEKRYAAWKAGAFLQWKSAGDLREIARALRSPVDDLEVLRDAKRRIEESIEMQSLLRTESALPAESKEADRVERRGRELGDRQARAEFEVRDTRVLMMPKRPAAAAKIGPAEKAQRDAQALLRDGATAQPEQERAIAALRSVLEEVDRQIAQAEKAVKDPVAELKKLSESIEKLIQEQKKAKEEAKAEKKPEELPKQAPKQAELAAKTEQLKQDPAADLAGAKDELAKAEQAMEKAAEALEDKKQENAVAKQDEAIKALEEAKKAADQALAEAQKAQEELLPAAAQQVAKAIEQTQAAQQANQEAAKQAPSLAEAQKKLADEAKKENSPAAPDANQAAQALDQGNLPQAVQEQKEALAEFQKAAAKEAQEAQAAQEAQKNQPSPQAQQAAEAAQAEAKQAGEMAQAQQALLEATQAAAEAQQAQAQAQQAAAQAQATAPPQAQPALAQAQQALGQAQQQSQQGEPQQAAQADAKALEALQQALAELNAQLAEAGLPQVQPGEPSDAQANGKEPGQGEPGQGEKPGQQPGQGQAKAPGQGQEPGQAPGEQPGQQPGQGQAKQPSKNSQEQNQSKGSGEREPDGQGKNAASQLADAKGGNSFLHLPPRQRELIRQSLNDTLPAEYSALIQQYYVNLARGRSASSPATGEKRK